MIKRSLTEIQAQVFKALAHETRLRIVEILATEGGKCVCELVEKLGFDQSTISKHLALMKSVGLVTSSKDGLRVTYSLSMPCVYQFMKCLQKLEQGSACDDGCLRTGEAAAAGEIAELANEPNEE